MNQHHVNRQAVEQGNVMSQTANTAIGNGIITKIDDESLPPEAGI
ncbi:hypothetical protein RIE95_02650 [Acidithiobacillus thiooxidans]|nr:hypothetical protein [Acidithiobacillus thiooxidans]MDR7925901.1 hypothetical protein [Acidithiobacillus thiooxidans]MDX5936601.1 hypothetical protein [Acidithiobacillus thiooxidans]